MAGTFGSTDSIVFGSSWPGSAVSMSFWMKTTQTTANVEVMSQHSSSSSVDGFGMVLNNTANKLLFAVKGSPYVLQLLSTSNVNDGAWRHFYADFGYSNGDAGRLCVNGIQEASGTNSNSVNANTHIPARLGKSNDTFWGGFVGSLAEVAFWQVKLTDAEIAALAAGYRPIRVRPRNLQCYAPLIRETYELTNYGGSPVATGTSVSDHPRVIA